MASAARNQVFSAIHPIGGLIPADMLVRISEGKDVIGSAPADYHIVGARSVRDEAERHWDYLKSVWYALRERLPAAPEADIPADPTGVAVAYWLEPLFSELGFGRLSAVGPAGIAADGTDRTFSITHRWNHVPIHLAGWNASLEKRHAGARSAVPPQSLVQECLNRTEAHLWAVLTNGRQLRLLRDSSALVTASFVEFDLEAIFDGELFSEFVLLYRMLHVSRFEPAADSTAASSCWLEKWRTDAIDSGIRALDQHRDGLQKAITALGTGFLRHPGNSGLRENLDIETFHAALLRLAFRLIFLFVAEDRNVLHPPTTAPQARQRYADYFSTARLRHQASRRQGTSHSDLYQALSSVLSALGDEHGRPELGLPGLGGFFDDTDRDAPLRGLSLSNADLLTAIRHLSRIRDKSSARWRQVDYRNIGPEELGSVYESLLELVPKHCATDNSLELVHRLGNVRKMTGTYYTPPVLIEILLDATLDPVIDDAQKKAEIRATAAGKPDATETIVSELFSITVCDPACGSGGFLLGAARRLAKRIAATRERNPEPTPSAVQHALHEVIERCLYGVDVSPMAVDLAKFSLWMEALEPGTPLSFLDSHIKLGNALIGATPAALLDGIPNGAFTATEGDDPKYAASLQAKNDKERKGQGFLFEADYRTNTVFASEVSPVGLGAATLRDVRRQASAYRQWRTAASQAHKVHAADAWCAAFIWHKSKDAPTAITHSTFRAIQEPGDATTSQSVHDEIVRLKSEYHFFHWHLEFPEIFSAPDNDSESANGWQGGFSCVVGNPPWDKLDFEDKKYFSVVDPSIAQISGQARRARVDEWVKENPDAGSHYHAARRKVKSTFLFASRSGTHPLCAQGLTVKGVNSLQTDQLFAEQFTAITAPHGRCGCIVPTAIATGASAQHLFRSFTERSAISCLYDFENRKPLFLGVHASYKFCILSLTGQDHHEQEARLAFFLYEKPEGNVFTLSPDEITLINPNTGTIPIFRTRRDANLTAAIYRRIPILWREFDKQGNHWRIAFKRMFDMTDDSDLFRTREQLESGDWTTQGNIFSKRRERMLPLYEGKMVQHFDHRWNSYYGSGNEDRRHLSASKKNDPSTGADPRYWIAEDGPITTVRKGKEVKVPSILMRLDEVGWQKDWLCGWRDVCRTTDERTAIAAFLPRTAVGHTYPLMLPRVAPPLVAALIAVQSSLVFDFVSRQKVSDAHMKLFIWKQLPVPTPQMLGPHTLFITPRVTELVYTAYDMTPLARDLGDTGEPFIWDEDRRAHIRAELDAYFFHLYGISRDDADYIMETFQSDAGGGLKNNEIAKYGDYRTKRLVLTEYDRMLDLDVSLDAPLVDGDNFYSALTPRPGHGPRHPGAS